MPSRPMNKTDVQRVIRRRRTELGISREQFAQRIGVTDPGMLSRIETGTEKLTVARLKRVANALEWTLGQLYAALEEEADGLSLYQMHDKIRERLDRLANSVEEQAEDIKRWQAAYADAAALREIDLLMREQQPPEKRHKPEPHDPSTT